MPQLETCRSCAFAAIKSNPPGTADSLMCKRYPPVVVQEEPSTSKFPDVSKYDWCGEFSRGAITYSTLT